LSAGDRGSEGIIIIIYSCKDTEQGAEVRQAGAKQVEEVTSAKSTYIVANNTLIRGVILNCKNVCLCPKNMQA